MGFIRGGAVVIFSVLLFLSFLGMNFALTLDRSLQLEVVKPEIINLINQGELGNIDFSQSMNLLQPEMVSVCNNSNSSEYNFNGSEINFIIPCEVIAKGEGNVSDYMINEVVDNLYYKEYNCTFIQCFELSRGEGPLFLVSKMSQDYWAGKFWFFFLVSIVLAGLILIFKEKRAGAFILTGILLGISSLPFIRLDSLLGLFNGTFMKFVHLLVSKSYGVFLTSLIIGIILISIGIILIIFGIGFKISRFASLFNRKSKEKKIEKKEEKGEVREERREEKIVEKVEKKEGRGILKSDSKKNVDVEIVKK